MVKKFLQKKYKMHYHNQQCDYIGLVNSYTFYNYIMIQLYILYTYKNNDNVEKLGRVWVRAEATDLFYNAPFHTHSNLIPPSENEQLLGHPVWTLIVLLLTGACVLK